MLLLFLIWISAINAAAKNQTSSRQFPKDFKFGVSTSAYQIEGGWIKDGKGWSVWDYMTHVNSEDITDGSNADVAADSYHLYKRDIDMLQELGVQTYKFSIAWTRIFPSGLSTNVNPKGIAYYNALIDELLARGIEPLVFMFHWDFPQKLQEEGGLLNNNLQTWFADYARVLFQNFGNRVKYWVTFNEPMIHCTTIYEMRIFAPKLRSYSSGRDFYHCIKNILLAHAKVYHMYDDIFRSTQKGNISINVYGDWNEPRSVSKDDAEAAKDLMSYVFGIIMDPIHKGNYPQRVIDRVAMMSSKQGLNSSRLLLFTNEEAKYINGTSDFVALNHYTTHTVNTSFTHLQSPSLYEDCACPSEKMDPRKYSNGLYKILLYIKENYDNPVVYIIENGVPTKTGLIDDDRVDFMRKHLTAVQNALEIGANVQGYFHWSLMDNFEWNMGYTARYGLYEVDFTDPERPRTPRKSAFVYKEIIRSRVIDYDYNPSVLIASNGANKIRIPLAIISVVISIVFLL